MLDKLNQLTESHGELKAGRGMVSGVSDRAVRHHPRRRPGAVLDAPRLSRGADAVAAARGAPQCQAHGLDGRLAPAHPGVDPHAHDGAGADLRARFLEERDRRLHRHRRLPGSVQPCQRQRAVGAAALFDRDAQLPPLARRTTKRSTRTTRRTSPSSITCSARPCSRIASGRSATVCRATTCRMVSGSS